MDEVERGVEDPWLFDVVDAELEDDSVWNDLGRRIGWREKRMKVEAKGTIKDKGYGDLGRRGMDARTSTFGDVHFG